MEKPILYCDCDGVILNTIEIAFDMMSEAGYDINDEFQRNYYFKHIVNWQDIFDRVTVINDSIEKIKLLKEKNVFSDIVVLTRLSGKYNEERLKRDLFKEYLPDTRVITIQFDIEKASVVKASNNILIDDEIRNCNNWRNNNGIAILFSEDSKDLRHNVINDLMDIPNTKGVKKLLKTRNF